MKRVFLGGTCNGSKWRDELIDMIHIDYFNPVVDDWTPECQKEERRQRQECDFCLYVITPRMSGVYSIAEVVEDSIKRPEKTIFCILREDERERGFKLRFTRGQEGSLSETAKMVARNGVPVFDSLESVSDHLNQFIEKVEVNDLYMIAEPIHRRIRGVFVDIEEAKRIAQSALATTPSYDCMYIAQAPLNCPIDNVWEILKLSRDIHGGFVWEEITE